MLKGMLLFAELHLAYHAFFDDEHVFIVFIDN